MAFDDQINRQTSLMNVCHECKYYLEQYSVTCHPQYAQNKTGSLIRLCA